MVEPLRVLICEDSENDMILLVHHLEAAGFAPVKRRVESADGLRSALADESWDIVLCDYKMPQFSGLDAIKIIQETDIDLPVIIISGNIGEEVAVEAMRTGVRDYFMKGKLKKLGPAIRRELREAGIQRERRQGIEKIQHLNSVLRAIRNIHQYIVRGPEALGLIEKTCQEMVSTRGFESAWAFLTPEAPGGQQVYECGWGDSFPDLIAKLEAGDLPGCCQKALEKPGAMTIYGPTATYANCDLCTVPEKESERCIVFVTNLRHADTHYGFLCISAFPNQAVDEEEEMLLAEVGADIGLALHSIEMISKRQQAEVDLKRKQRAITLNNEIAGVFLTSPPDQIHADALGVVCEALDSSCGFFGYVDEAGDLVCPAMTTTMWEQGYIADNCRVFPISAEEGEWAKALHEKQTLIANDSLNFSGGRLPMKCAMAVPIVHREALIGQFFLADKPGGYDEDDRILLESAAGQTAPVLSAILVADRRKRELEELEEQYRQAQKMEAIGRLAGGVAHDFNNLLTVINGYAGLALDGLREGDPLQKSIQQIQGAGKRAAALTHQLLAFSRKQVMELKIVDQNEVIHNLEKMLGRLIREDVELRILLADNLGNVRVDPGQIEQVVMNLVVNARDAMPKGGILTIETANVELGDDYVTKHPGNKAGPYVMLKVTDDGTGMDEDTKAQVFEPFFTTKVTGQGTGLGLATVYGIIKQSDGDIVVESEPGKGTTFRVYLPRVVDAKTEPGPKVELKTHRGTETVLIVEDDKSVRGLVSRILESAGYRVIMAVNGGDALLKCERYIGEIHLVLTDVVMPMMGGRELADRLAEVKMNLKVLYMSGYTDNDIVNHGLHSKDVHFIGKPFSAQDLLVRVRAALEDERPYRSMAKEVEEA